MTEQSGDLSQKEQDEEFARGIREQIERLNNAIEYGRNELGLQLLIEEDHSNCAHYGQKCRPLIKMRVWRVNEY